MTRTLRIATFNLENLDDRPDREPSLAARLRVLQPRLRRLAADLLCLQEVNAQPSHRHGPRRLDALDALLRGTPYETHARVATTDAAGKGPLDVHNLVILSRLPVRASRQLHHDLVAPPSFRPVTAEPPAESASALTWDRPLLHAEIDLGRRRPLHLVNLHLRAPRAAFIPGQKAGAGAWKSVPGWAEGFFLAAVKRAGQALEARLLVDRLFDAEPRALIAVCGDFNAGSREMPTRLLRADTRDIGDERLATRALAPVEEMVAEARRYSVLHRGRKVMLDHLLVSPALLPWCREVVIDNEGLGDEAAPAAERSPESFHAPLLAEFVVPENDD